MSVDRRSVYVQECAKREQSDREKQDTTDGFEQTATLYFCDEDDSDTAAASKESDYGSYPLPDY